jgi:hypothetical protein
MATRTRYKLGEKLEVTWFDAYCPETGTKTIEAAKKIRLYERKTIGYFVQITEEALTIASTWDKSTNGEDEVDDVNCIPVGWSTEILRLDS